MATKSATQPKGEATPATKPRTALPEGRIKVLAKENPKRVGSASRERFSLYRNGMSVTEFLKAGGSRADIRWDIKHGFIEVVS